MADKRKVKKNIKRLQSVKTWQLVVILVLFGLLTATFLRLNNIGMVERRTAVLSADKSNDSTSLKNNLYALQRYSSSHMNAGTGVIYLQGEYQKDVAEIVKKAKNDDVANKDAIAKADEICRKQFPGYSQAYIQCNNSEQAKFKGSDTLDTTLKFPNPELYRHTFISPVWSPDFAGWSIVICGIIVVIIVLRIIGLLFLKILLRRRYSSI